MYKLALFLWRKGQLRAAESILIWAYKNSRGAEVDGQNQAVVLLGDLEIAIKQTYVR